MPITQRQLDIKSALIQDAYQALEKEIMERLIKRLKAKTVAELSTDSIFQWQLEKLQELRMLNIETLSELAQQASNISQEQLQELVIKQGYEDNLKANEELAKIAKVPAKPWNNLDAILHQYFDSSWLDFDNHINQTLITTNYSQNWVAKKYQQVLNDVVAKTLTGFVTPQDALKQSIYDMVSKGVMTDFVDKAGRTWSLERYVRTVIKTTTSTVYNDLRTERGINEYGIVTALMSSHSAAREACSHIQGKFVLMVPKNQAPEKYRDLPSIYDYGYGTPEGTRGINCNHRFYSQLPMASTGIPAPPSPKEAQANAEIVAKQRRLEVAVRDAKKKLNAAELMGNNEDVEYFKSLVRKRQASVRQLINDHEGLLVRDYSREFVGNK